MNYSAAYSARWHQAEWVQTFALATLPITILYDPMTIEVSSFRHLLDFGVTAHVLAVTAGLVVVVRAVSLWENGKLLPWTAYGRIVGAMLTGVLWLEMSMALLQLHVTSNRAPSIGIGFWAIYAAGEVWSCYRAACDAYHRGR